MTPDEKKLYALMAVAEQQQNLVNQAVKELQITEERIQKVIAEQTHSTVSKSLNTGLQEGTEELIKTAKALGRLNNSIESASDQFSWKFIGIVLGILAILMLGIIWLFSVYIKPLENISKIESLKRDGIQLDIRSCNVEGESKTCVRVMKKQCNYGKYGDLCIIDPK
jgi:ATP-dependent Zn protease